MEQSENLLSIESLTRIFSIRRGLLTTRFVAVDALSTLAWTTAFDDLTELVDADAVVGIATIVASVAMTATIRRD